MNLNNLKPAWQKFRLLNSMQRMDQEEILFMLESAEDIAVRKINRFPMHIVVFTVLTLCCHGG